MNDSDPSRATPSNENSEEFHPRHETRLTATDGVRTSPYRILYPTAKVPSLSNHDTGDSQAPELPAAAENLAYQTAGYSIPYVLQQNAQEASICFFFRHYTGTSIDPEAGKGFNGLWQPMYLQASAQSPIRLATAAVAVNITMLWCSQGCDRRPARVLFTKALAAAREALQDPFRRSADETLMAVLIFDLYDSMVLHYAPSPLNYGKHKHGALAMIEQRGYANLATSQSCALIGAVRHTLLPYLLASRIPFPEHADVLFDHSSMANTKASVLDLISVRLSRMQSRLWTLRLEHQCLGNSTERSACYKEIITEAIQVENLLLNWKANVTDPEWLAEFIPRDSVTDSIRDAGFYGLRCSVWQDLSYGRTWMLFSIRSLLTLQVIRQCFADDPSLLGSPREQALLARTNGAVQELVDVICECVPFFLGDTIIPKNPMYSPSISFPFAMRTDPRTGSVTRLPSLRSNHQHRAGASAGWILFPHMVDVWRLAEPEDDAVPIALREGQLDWIKGQVKRLQNIFLFCDPVWFKR